jgi:hypothetical protein
MEKLIYDKEHKEILVSSITAQIEVVKAKLAGLYKLLSQLDPSFVGDNNSGTIDVKPLTNEVKKRVYKERENSKDYYNKIKEVISISGKPLTSREILNGIYDLYPTEILREDDRKNIGALSAVLIGKTKENKIEKLKQEGGHDKFRLVDDMSDIL